MKIFRRKENGKKFRKFRENLVKIKLLILIVISGLMLLFCKNTEDKVISPVMNVMSFNLRYDNPGDGPNAWKFRKELVCKIFTDNDIDIAGTQEALHHQIADLELCLREFSWTGVGRDDGKQAGEYAAIFYRKKRFRQIDGGTFWLSEKPEQPGSMGWDAACTRIVTWAEFTDLRTNKNFYFFNTHFDHAGDTARLESARMLSKKVKFISRGKHTLVSGDFNFSPESEPYQMLNGSIILKDARAACRTEAKGPDWTFHGFIPAGGRFRLDYIFISDDVKVYSHRTVDTKWDNRYPSDHLPLIIAVSL